LHRSFNEDVLEATVRYAEWWSAIDNNNVVDLGGPTPALTLVPAIKPKDDDSNGFKFGSDDDDSGGNGADSVLDFSSFDRPHKIFVFI
jgi:hypothetical protein